MGATGRLRQCGFHRHSNSGEYLRIYRDAAKLLPWGSTAGTLFTGTGTGSTLSIPVYGLVKPQTTPAPGTYTDMIVVTVSY